MFRMRFVLSKCETVLRKLTGSKPAIVLAGGGFGEMDTVSHLASSISPGDRIANGLLAHT